MRRKLKTLRAKQGHSQNGAPRSLIDLAIYREKHALNAAIKAYDTGFSGWRNASRPRDQAISLRSRDVPPG
jgi:hypothetical protein